MKLEVIIHEAEEGGYRAAVPAIPGCATRGKPLTSYCAISMKPLRAACLWISQVFLSLIKIKSWKSPFENGEWKAVLPYILL